MTSRESLVASLRRVTRTIDTKAADKTELKVAIILSGLVEALEGGDFYVDEYYAAMEPIIRSQYEHIHGTKKAKSG